MVNFLIIRSKAPLRISFAGGGTDLSLYCDNFGGCVLNATINMYVHCTIEPLNSNKIIFSTIDRGEYFEYDSLEQLKVDQNMSIHKEIYKKIIQEFNKGEPLPLILTTYSDVPAGSGLGSSSTMVVCILKAFVELLNLPLGKHDVARLAFEIERIDLKMSGGKQDQYAATFGGFNFIDFCNNQRVIVNPLIVKNSIVSELEDSIVMFNSGILRESYKVINEQKNNIINNRIQSLEALHQIKRDAVLIKEAILSGEIKKIADIMNDSWEAKKSIAESISNDYLDSIYKTALKNGAYGGKVSGAGGGGFMLFIVSPQKKLDVINALSSYNGQIVDIKFSYEGAQSWKIY